MKQKKSPAFTELSVMQKMGVEPTLQKTKKQRIYVICCIYKVFLRFHFSHMGVIFLYLHSFFQTIQHEMQHEFYLRYHTLSTFSFIIR